MIADALCYLSNCRRSMVAGSFPDGTVVSSNSACCHRACSGDKSGRHCSSGELPATSKSAKHPAMSATFSHDPVMLEEILGVFADLDQGVFLDATVGGGGHSHPLLMAHPFLTLLGIDQDTQALSASELVFSSSGLSSRVTLCHARFDAVTTITEQKGFGSLAGALFDLGVSSHQFDVSERGFSYRFDAPLDMRMNQAQSLTAEKIVNSYSREQLISLLRENSDERFAVRITDAIIASRPIDSTTVLAQVVADAIPAPARRRGGHPAKRTFQAIRIEVNAELTILASTLRSVIDLLQPGARLAVLSYHSGEDRIVKAVMRSAESGNCTCPNDLPCQCGAIRLVKRVRVARQATASEQARNTRSTSARLRVVEKIKQEI